jgi:hypothetical protein
VSVAAGTNQVCQPGVPSVASRKAHGGRFGSRRHAGMGKVLDSSRLCTRQSWLRREYSHSQVAAELKLLADAVDHAVTVHLVEGSCISLEPDGERVMEHTIIPYGFYLFVTFVSGNPHTPGNVRTMYSAYRTFVECEKDRFFALAKVDGAWNILKTVTFVSECRPYADPFKRAVPNTDKQRNMDGVVPVQP